MLSTRPMTIDERANQLTCERPAPGVVVFQPRGGYHYVQNPILLVGFCLENERPLSFVDVGTGPGIMAFLLARQGVPGLGIDIRPEWIELARSSNDYNQLSVVFREADARTFRPRRTYDLAVINGRLHIVPLHSDPLVAQCTHQLAGTLADLVGAAASWSRRVGVVIPTSADEHVAQTLAEHARPVARWVRLEGGLSLLEGRAGGRCRGVEVLPWRRGDAWSEPVQRWCERAGVTAARAASAP